MLARVRPLVRFLRREPPPPPTVREQVQEKVVETVKQVVEVPGQVKHHAKKQVIKYTFKNKSARGIAMFMGSAMGCFWLPVGYRVVMEESNPKYCVPIGMVIGIASGYWFPYRIMIVSIWLGASMGPVISNKAPDASSISCLIE